MSTFLLIVSMLSFTTNNDGDDLQLISELVHQYVAAADNQNVKKMDAALHAEFRVVANQLLGSDELSLIDKPSYLELLKAGQIGGDERNVRIRSISQEGKNAVVHVTLTGKQLIFHSFIQMAKGKNGDWKVITDMPQIEKAG